MILDLQSENDKVLRLNCQMQNIDVKNTNKI